MKLAGTIEPHQFVLGLTAMAAAGGKNGKRAKRLLHAVMLPLAELGLQMVLAVDIADLDKHGRRTSVMRIQGAGQARMPSQLIAIIELPRTGKVAVRYVEATSTDVLEVIRQGAHAGLVPQ